MLSGFAVLLFASYVVLVARTHDNVAGLAVIRAREKYIWIVSIAVFLITSGVSGYGVYRLNQQSKGLLDAIRRGEQIKQSVIDSSIAPVADIDKWVTSTDDTLRDHGLDTCAVDFEFPQAGPTLMHAGIPIESSKLWNDVNSRTEALRKCVRDRK